jgi:hypothetical protein
MGLRPLGRGTEIAILRKSQEAVSPGGWAYFAPSTSAAIAARCPGSGTDRITASGELVFRNQVPPLRHQSNARAVTRSGHTQALIVSGPDSWSFDRNGSHILRDKVRSLTGIGSPLSGEGFPSVEAGSV